MMGLLGLVYCVVVFFGVIGLSEFDLIQSEEVAPIFMFLLVVSIGLLVSCGVNG